MTNKKDIRSIKYDLFNRKRHMTAVYKARKIIADKKRLDLIKIRFGVVLMSGPSAQ